MTGLFDEEKRYRRLDLGCLRLVRAECDTIVEDRSMRYAALQLSRARACCSLHEYTRYLQLVWVKRRIACGNFYLHTACAESSMETTSGLCQERGWCSTNEPCLPCSRHKEAEASEGSKCGKDDRIFPLVLLRPSRLIVFHICTASCPPWLLSEERFVRPVHLAADSAAPALLRLQARVEQSGLVPAYRPSRWRAEDDM